VSAIAIPSNVNIRRYRIVPSYTMAAFEPLIGNTKYSDFNAGMSDKWAGTYTFAAASEQELFGLLAWTRRLKIDGEFFAFDPGHRVPFGGVVSGLVVDGGSQTGSTIDVKGATPSTTHLVAGDYFQISSQYFQVLEDFTTDGSGEGTISFFPSLRFSPSNNAPVITDNPVMVARLTSPVPHEMDFNKVAEITIAWEEVA